ncbi:MAG: TolC family protein, partial [Crocinitomicaceae bacterium]
EINNKISLKNLYENCALLYYNIVSLQAQFQSSVDHLENADKLYEISQNKFNAGLINQQDLNESILHRKSLGENVKQIQFAIEQQYLTLKILCDIPEDFSFRIDEAEPKNEALLSNLTSQINTNQLALNYALTNERLMRSNYNKSRLAFTPTFSAFASHQEQQFNTKSGLFDPNVKWIPSNYVGLRLNLRIPSAMEVSQSSKVKYDYLLSKNTVKKEQSQQQYHKNQLSIETQKQISQRDSNKEIFLIRKTNYEKNLANYEKGIISIETLIKSMNEMISSQFNFISSQKMVEMMYAKINLNNKIN